MKNFGIMMLFCILATALFASSAMANVDMNEPTLGKGVTAEIVPMVTTAMPAVQEAKAIAIRGADVEVTVLKCFTGPAAMAKQHIRNQIVASEDQYTTNRNLPMLWRGSTAQDSPIHQWIKS